MGDSTSYGRHSTSRRRLLVLSLSGVAGLAAVAAGFGNRATLAAGRPVPAALIDMEGGQRIQTAVIAGGCFWGVQGVFQHVEGVLRAVSGYAGGTAATARYELVSAGRTAHAEAVEIVFDSSKISYGRILEIFFSVVHDPTEIDRQGPDVGKHYRSAIFPRDAAQAKVASAYIAQLSQAGVFARPIATTLEAGADFYRAEDYHQDYMVRYPQRPYIAIHDLPKLERLKLVFADIYRPEPVLVLKKEG